MSDSNYFGPSEDLNKLAPMQRDSSTLEAVLQECYTADAELSDVWRELESRLTPVMTPSEPVNSAKDDGMVEREREAESPVISLLRTHVRKMRSYTHGIAHLIQRLEI